MNEAGRAAGPARGALGVDLDHVLAIHDEIDLPFGVIEARLGGGLAGHNGLKSLKRELGSPDFRRIRVGVGRPDSTDPEIVSAHVLGRFSEGKDEVAQLVDERRRRGGAAALSTDRLIQDRPISGSDRSLATSRGTRRFSSGEPFRIRPGTGRHDRVVPASTGRRPAERSRASPARSTRASCVTLSCSSPRSSRTASGTRAPTTRSACGSGCATAGSRSRSPTAGPASTPATVGTGGDAEGGRGLMIVEALADRWGVSRDARTRVWFELSPRPVSRAQAG